MFLIYQSCPLPVFGLSYVYIDIFLHFSKSLILPLHTFLRLSFRGGILETSMVASNREGIGLSYRARIFELLRSPTVDSKERQLYSYSVPSPHRLFKIPAPATETT